jgi:hypothetical protein
MLLWPLTHLEENHFRQSETEVWSLSGCYMLLTSLLAADHHFHFSSQLPDQNIIIHDRTTLEDRSLALS